MTKIFRIFAAMLLVIGTGAAAKAQDITLLDRLPSATAKRLTLLVDSAAVEGLPTKPLILRALEGQAKNIPDQVIVDVVSRLRGDLRAALQALGVGTGSDDLTSAAAAIKAGISKEKLVQLRQWRGKAPLMVPLDAWLGLINKGAMPEKAWTHIEGLAKRQARDAEFIRLTPADLNRGNPQGSP